MAILDLDAKMVSKLYNNNPGKFVMSDLLTIDTFFVHDYTNRVVFLRSLSCVLL